MRGLVDLRGEGRPRPRAAPLRPQWNKPHIIGVATRDQRRCGRAAGGGAVWCGRVRRGVKCQGPGLHIFERRFLVGFKRPPAGEIGLGLVSPLIADRAGQGRGKGGGHERGLPVAARPGVSLEARALGQAGHGRAAGRNARPARPGPAHDSDLLPPPPPGAARN